MEFFTSLKIIIFAILGVHAVIPVMSDDPTTHAPPQGSPLPVKRSKASVAYSMQQIVHIYLTMCCVVWK